MEAKTRDMQLALISKIKELEQKLSDVEKLLTEHYNKSFKGK